MKTRYRFALALISATFATACNDSAEPRSKSQEIRINAQDIARLDAHQELELPLTPGLLYTFSDEAGPIALDRITLIEGGRETPLELAAAHIAGHFGAASEGSRVGEFCVGAPGVEGQSGDASPRPVGGNALLATPAAAPEEADLVRCCFWCPGGMTGGEICCDLCEWPPAG